VPADSLREQLQSSLVGRYEIERELGRGGMATVYLARDVKHHRHVALKLLNPELGAVLGAERFLSEIRVTANLQHPNLLPLFDSGSADGLLFYVMPYIEGESLRRRLDRERQLPIDEAVRLAVAVADALDYAHQHGVIHRDLKPENILLQHGQPVVADFGIALAVSNAGGERVTQTGLSLGTPQYMSPEQATGDRVIDARADVYSLGAVTYEMLAGEPPHHGTTAQAIIAKLMTEVPRPLPIIRHTVPLHVDEAVRCALEKLPADRFATAGEFAAGLRGGSIPHRTHHTVLLTARRGPRPRALTGALTGVSALALVLAALLWRSASRPERGTIRFVLDLPPDQRIATPEGSSVNLSPDGRTVAYVATTGGSGTTRIFVRRIDSLAARLLPGSDGGNTPTFSPDGKWIAFKTSADLRKVPLSGGGAEIITPLPNDWQNFAWSSAGDVVLAAAGYLWRVGEKGKLTRITAPDTAAGEIGHAGPIFLNDETIAFWLQKPTTDGTLRGIGLTNRAGGPYAVLDVPGDVPLGYVEGHLLVSDQRGVLLAYPVDLRRRRVTGPAIELVSGIVWIGPGGLQARVARDGSLAYIGGGSGRRLVLLDGRGGTIAEAPELRDYRGGTSISPDGRRVAVTVLRRLVGGRNAAFSDVWIWDVESASLAPFTSDGGQGPRWSPDGKRIAYLRTGWYDNRNVGDPGTSERSLRSEVWWAPIDGSSPAELLVRFPTSARVYDIDFHPTGASVVLAVRDSATAEDIYLLNLGARNAAPIALARTGFRETEPRISPDGRWMAYASDETGRFEIYVRPLVGTGTRVKVSTGGAQLPQWASDGRRLVYTSEGGRTIAAALNMSGTAVTIARQDTIALDGVRSDVDPRTDRILVIRQPDDRRIIVVSNWLAEVRPKLRGR
jgi:eukaryotic-like serine/threonine-protein kinase